MKLLVVQWEDQGVWRVLDVKSENEIPEDELANVDQQVIDIVKFENGKWFRLAVSSEEEEGEDGAEDTTTYTANGWIELP